jgi:hypothetical protein
MTMAAKGDREGVSDPARMKYLERKRLLTDTPNQHAPPRNWERLRAVCLQVGEHSPGNERERRSDTGTEEVVGGVDGGNVFWVRVTKVSKAGLELFE